jgi:nitrous oxidase accessory protein NosD
MNPDSPTTDSQVTTDLPLLAGRYRLLQKLGQGGMGAVHLGLDTQLQRQVAVKLLPPSSVHDADAVARFQREARALAKLSHPNIVQAFDSGRDGDQSFLVMEYVEGPSLAAVLRDDGRLGPTRAADYAHQAALALQHAHGHGLIHRDVKPSNLLLTAEGTVKLLDLGLARFLQDQVGDPGLTREGVGLGTPDYAAPEQFRDARHADPRSDVYSLGCTLYHLIAGRVPFPGTSLSEKMEAHERTNAPPLEEFCPEVPTGLALAVQKMMAKRPADRFETAGAAAEALAPYVAGASPTAARVRSSCAWDGSKLATMTAGPTRPRRLLLVVAAVCALAVVLLGVVAAGVGLGWFGGERHPLSEGPGDPPKSGPADTHSTDQAPVPAAEDPNVLTVSQKPEAGGKYRTINAALAEVKPGQTIRVLDGATYAEALDIRGATTKRNINLEAVRGATIEVPREAKIGVYILGVPDVVVRGFRVQTSNSQTLLFLVEDNAAGVVLEDLELRKPLFNFRLEPKFCPTISLEDLRGADGDPPVIVRRCRVTGGDQGVQVFAADRAVCQGVLIHDNHFADMRRAIYGQGNLQRVCVAGNRVQSCSLAGLHLADLGDQTRDVLLANNTVLDCNNALGYFDKSGAVRGAEVRFVNNLVLGCTLPLDLVFYRYAPGTNQHEPGDGAEIAGKWRVACNWREVALPPNCEGDFRAWVPANEKDVRKDRIEGVNRDPKSPDFLRPARDSPLATDGAGTEDPALPCYVGAVPPEGVAPWDWERTWRLPKDAQLLTVSKDPKHKAKYATINAALKDVAQPWATVRVLDEAIYQESVALSRASVHAGLTLEAIGGATLEIPSEANGKVLVSDVPGVTLRGFKVRSPESVRISIVVGGRSPGVTLEQLEMAGRTGPGQTGISLERLAVEPDEPPVTVRRCRFLAGNIGVRISGTNGPCRGVVVRENTFNGQTTGTVILGQVTRLQVIGNRFLGAHAAGVSLGFLAPETRDLLVANNTFLECYHAVRLADDAVNGKNIRVCNNLVLAAQRPDFASYQAEKGTPLPPSMPPMDGRLVAAAWYLTHNWRELPVPAEGNPLARAWIPPTGKEVRIDQIDGVNRDPKSPGFLRPDPKSPLATKGAGNDDPALPRYVGALPPEGAEPWDWDRTLRPQPKKAEDPK